MRLTDEQHWPLALIFLILLYWQSVTSQVWPNAGATEANPADTTMAAQIVPRAIAWLRPF